MHKWRPFYSISIRSFGSPCLSKKKIIRKKRKIIDGCHHSHSVQFEIIRMTPITDGELIRSIFSVIFFVCFFFWSRSAYSLGGIELGHKDSHPPQSPTTHPHPPPPPHPLRALKESYGRRLMGKPCPPVYWSPANKKKLKKQKRKGNGDAI